jgi:hypothetical protein
MGRAGHTFSIARAALCLHNGAIDEIQAHARSRCHLIKDLRPDATAGPTVEPIEALSNLEGRDKAISAQRCRKIECARYDADLAERRYEDADPSHRLVAATLEKRRNDAMQRVLELEVEFASFQRQAMRVLTPEQKQQILQLGKDFPRLWKAPTTSTCDRKRMLRLLIRDITVAKDTDPKLLHLQVPLARRRN